MRTRSRGRHLRRTRSLGRFALIAALIFGAGLTGGFIVEKVTSGSIGQGQR